LDFAPANQTMTFSLGSESRQALAASSLSARFMNKDELRQALDAASLSDLASDLDGERRDAADHAIDEFRSIEAVVRLPK
jgi:hypothetical protein